MNRHDPDVSAADAAMNTDPATPGRDHGGIQSVDIGMSVLRALAQASGPMSLKEISAACRMAPSKTHRYLHSLVAGGLLAQQKRSGKYDLGPFALQLGASAIRRIDVVHRVSDHLEELVDHLGMAAQIAIWSTEGPLAVRWQRTADAPIMREVFGTTFPLLRSATGNVFLAYLPERITRPIVAAEVEREGKLAGALDVDISEIVRTVREQGYALSLGTYVPNHVGISAPIINWDEQICAAVTVITRLARDPAEHFDAAAYLKAFCRNLSAIIR